MFHEPQAQQTEGQLLQTDPIMDNSPLPVGQDPKGLGRLLVVDDAQCTRRILFSFLARMNVEVDMVENGQMACDMAEKSKTEGHPYDLILMDIQMPQMNGYDATRWLRGHGWECPIVAVTAHTKEEDRQKCVEAGCDDHFSKPITDVALRKLIEQYLNGTVVSLW